jgi:ADP-heptose:LPS heptosyltransferase
VYKLDSIEAMQNDSFFIAVNTDTKYVIVSKPKEEGSVQFFPFKQTMDSLLRLSAKRYDIIIDKNKTKKQASILFNAKDTAERVRQFLLDYNTETNLINTLKYSYYEYKPLAKDFKEEAPELVLHKRVLLIEFSKYSHSPMSDALLNTARFVSFEAGKCTLKGNYKGYKLYYAPEPNVKLTGK